MFQSKLSIQEKNNSTPYFFINLVFAFFPVSLIIGSFIVNLNLFLFCCLGIYYLKSNIFTTKLDFSIKIIFLLFAVLLFSTSLNFAKVFYLEGFSGINTLPSCYSTNCFSPLAKLIKSILFLRFFLLLLLIYLLNKLSILNFKFFSISAAFVSLIVSADLIYQYIFGFNIIGLKSSGFSNSGFFGDELIAGGFILRFAFFLILLTILLYKNKNFAQFIYPVIVTCVVAFGLLFAGNRMPFILFPFGLFLIFLLKIKIKKILLLSIITFSILFKFIILSDNSYKNYLYNSYYSFYGKAKNMINIAGIQKWKKSEINQSEESMKSKTLFITARHESSHRRIFMAAIDTWKDNKIFGNGIKSFREDCWKLQYKPDYYLGEELYPDKKLRLCSNHPHNYYLEILTETGIVGLFVTLIIGLLFLIFIFKNLKYIKQINFENFIILSASISLILETIPLKSTGSLFSTNNATYLILISSIVLCHKTLIKKQ